MDDDPGGPSGAAGDGGDESGMVLAPVLTPHGALALRPSNDGVDLPVGLGAQLQAVFARGSGHGLLALGADHVGAALPPVLSYWRELGVRYVTALCALPGLGDGRTKSAVPLPPDDDDGRVMEGCQDGRNCDAAMWMECGKSSRGECDEVGVIPQHRARRAPSITVTIPIIARNTDRLLFATHSLRICDSSSGGSPGRQDSPSSQSPPSPSALH